MPARKVRDTPGSRWYYSGGLTQVAAGVIERLTGQAIDQYAEKILFGPLASKPPSRFENRENILSPIPMAVLRLRLGFVCCVYCRPV